MHLIRGGGGLTATIDAEHGGRIVSLVSGTREWLSPSSPLDGNAPRAFVHAGTGGWDDAIPTVEACVLPGGEVLADHGEVWDRTWLVTASSDSHLAIRVDLRSVSLRFERFITATVSGLRVSWRVTTDSADAVSFLWSAHPLFSAEPGSRIDVQVGADVIEEYPRRGHRGRVPVTIDELPEAGAVKLFTSGVSRASVVHPDGSRLSLEWDVEELPHLGLYLDRGEFTVRPVMAIEPTMAASDSAARADALWSVSAGQPRVWHVDVTVDVAVSSP